MCIVYHHVGTQHSSTHVHWLLRIDGAHRIMVATSEGRLYIGGIDPREGGECRILKEFR